LGGEEWEQSISPYNRRKEMEKGKRVRMTHWQLCYGKKEFYLTQFMH
jgi:hypothetical protein